jgi:hypothetical protein
LKQEICVPERSLFYVRMPKEHDIYDAAQRKTGERNMNLRAFMILVTILSVGYGVAFLLIPEFLINFYGVATSATPAVVLGFRFFGATLLAVGLIFWFAKESHDWSALRALLIGDAVGDIAGVLVSIWGTATGIMNAFGWSVVLIYALLLAGCGYFLQLGQQRTALT